MNWELCLDPFIQFGFCAPLEPLRIGAIECICFPDVVNVDRRLELPS